MFFFVVFLKCKRKKRAEYNLIRLIHSRLSFCSSNEGEVETAPWYSLRKENAGAGRLDVGSGSAQLNGCLVGLL